MPRRTTYIVVEGPHDVEFIGRILRKGPHSFHYQNAKSKVDPFWYPLIPSSYPVGRPPNDFLGRVPMPLFYQNEKHSVAVQSADGISKIVARLEETLATPGMTEPDSIGLVLDSDSTETPAKRAADLAAELAKDAPHLAGAFPSLPGSIQPPTPPGGSRRGVFVFPDNLSQGTLEDLLLECGRSSYPDLLSLADAHVAAAAANLIPPTATWTKEDHEEFRAPSGSKKATIASATAILKPGRTSQVSVNDNRWVDPQTLALPKVKAVADWLEQLVLGKS
jgi:hypothetical protein